jgi:hypothetical protein
MTREDEIKRAKESVYGDGTCRAAHHFETGVRWADAHPADETIQRIVMLYKQWYTTESTMSMVDYIKQHLKS